MTLTDANGDAETVTVVVVAPLPVEMVLKSQSSACDAATGTLIIASASGGVPNFDIPFGYKQLRSTGLANDDTLTNSAPGEYTLTNTDPNGCIAVDTIVAAQLSQPTDSVIALDTLLSDGEGTTLFASRGGTYLWSPTTGLSSTTYASPTASPTDAAT
jgi:hypothetical protein